MEIYTIGFTKKTAEEFFGILKRACIRRLIDVRLNNVSQLAGFTKRDDLSYFLRQLCEADYLHQPLLAPTDDILSAYKKKLISWATYEERFVALMKDRRIEGKIGRSLFAEPAVLLCSEPTATKCHRRLVAEYLQEHWGVITIKHL